MDKRILICCTFREFDGGDNDKIQREFLKNIEKQSYRNFELVVTNFREKNVKKVLQEFQLNINYIQSSIDCPISFTHLIENALPYIKKGKNILLWVNADMIMSENFLQTINNEYEPGFSGTSFPQRIFASIQDYNNDIAIYDEGSEGLNYREEKHWKNTDLSSFYQIDPNHWLPDVIFIDADNLLKKKFKDSFFKFRMDEHWPGMIQNLMLGFYNDKQAPRKNIVYLSQIGEILNNYANIKNPKKEDHMKAKVKQFQNTPKLIDIAKEYCIYMGFNQNLQLDHFLAKLNQLKTYKIVGTKKENSLFKNYCNYWEKFYKDEFNYSVIEELRKKIKKFINKKNKKTGSIS